MMTAAEVVVGAEDQQETKCEWNRDTAMGVVTAINIIAGVLVIIGAVETTFVNASWSPKDWILGIYLIMLGLLAIAADLRYFKILRSPIFTVMRFVYFLTSYTARGSFYFFIGTLSWDGVHNTFSMLASISACFAGLVTIGGNAWYKFPKFIDPQIAKMQAEARLKWERDEAQRKLLSLQNTPTNATAAAVMAGARTPRAASDTAFAYEPPAENDALRSPFEGNARSSKRGGGGGNASAI